MGKKGFWLAGVLSGLVFLLLLGIRLDFFHRVATEEEPSASALKTGLEMAWTEAWMNIFQDRQKIGYAHRFLKKQAGGFEFQDRTYLKLNLMGLPRDMFMETKGRLHDDYSLASFDFDLSSGSLLFSANGRVKDRMLNMETGDRKVQIPLEKSVYLPGALSGLFKAMGSVPGKTMEFEVFDPFSGVCRKVLMRLGENETLEVSGKPFPCRKVFLEYKGLSQTAWVDETGQVIQETGPMGLRLVQTTKSKAISGFSVASAEDLTRLVSIPANRILSRPEDLAFLRIRMSNLPEGFSLQGGRQTLKDGILTIFKENLEAIPHAPDPEAEQFLGPSPDIQSDHPDIKSLVSGLISNTGPDLEKAKLLVNWVYENIEKTPVISIPNAVNTLKTRKGDCNEHTALLAAMARAADIPARMETGLVYLKGRFYYHAWNSLYLGAWITADSALGQIPADATHIRLIQGGLESQFNLARVMGTLQLEILND